MYFWIPWRSLSLTLTLRMSVYAHNLLILRLHVKLSNKMQSGIFVSFIGFLRLFFVLFVFYKHWNRYWCNCTESFSLVLHIPFQGWCTENQPMANKQTKKKTNCIALQKWRKCIVFGPQIAIARAVQINSQKKYAQKSNKARRNLHTLIFAVKWPNVFRVPTWVTYGNVSLPIYHCQLNAIVFEIPKWKYSNTLRHNSRLLRPLCRSRFPPHCTLSSFSHTFFSCRKFISLLVFRKSRKTLKMTLDNWIHDNVNKLLSRSCFPHPFFYTLSIDHIAMLASTHTWG